MSIYETLHTKAMVARVEVGTKRKVLVIADDKGDIEQRNTLLVEVGLLERHLEDIYALMAVTAPTPALKKEHTENFQFYQAAANGTLNDIVMAHGQEEVAAKLLA